jgi:hypothetical protein
MTDMVVINQALIREWINGSAMILCLTLTIMICIFMWDTAVEWYASNSGKSFARTKRHWSFSPGIKTACALFWVFAAETYRTGAVWFLYQIGKNAKDVGAFFDAGAYWSSYGYLMAGIALNGGLLRAIYIFTPPDWKDYVWILSLIAAVLFCMSPEIIETLRRF